MPLLFQIPKSEFVLFVDPSGELLVLAPESPTLFALLSPDQQSMVLDVRDSSVLDLSMPVLSQNSFSVNPLFQKPLNLLIVISRAYKIRLPSYLSF